MTHGINFFNISNELSIIPGCLPQYISRNSVVLLGDASVGKTSIIHNYSKGANSIINHKPTLGIDYFTKNIELSHSHTVKAQIWDTAGQENYRSLTLEYDNLDPAT